jgi:hypothetical protein
MECSWFNTETNKKKTSINNGICKKRREDTFFAAQSESRISAPFFASKMV